MSDYFTELERELRRATSALARGRRRRVPWPAFLAAALAVLLAASAAAKVTGIWKPDLGPEPVGRTVTNSPGATLRAPAGCTERIAPRPDLIDGPPSPRLLAVLGALRHGRPVPLARARRLTESTLGLHARGVSYRYVHTLGDGPTPYGQHFYVIPVRELRLGADIPVRCFPPAYRADERFRRSHPLPGICLSDGSASTCADLRTLKDRGVPMSSGTRSTSRVSYVVPNGVQSVTARYSDGSARTFEVYNNLVTYPVAVSAPQSMPQTWSWRARGGGVIRVVRSP